MTAAASPGPAATFIPARKMGCLILKSLVRGVLIVVILIQVSCLSFFRYTCPVLSSRGWCVDGLFKWGKGENSTNGWRARIEDRGSHVTDFFDYFAKFSEALSRRSSCPTNRGLRSADGNGQYISVVLVSGMANESG